MVNFLMFLDRLINYYLYFVVMSCFLSLVPNINPDYPLFNVIFKAAGFYIIPPVFGFIIAPAIIMTLLVLCSMGIRKIIEKYFKPQEPQILVMTPEEFIRTIQKNNNGGRDDSDENSSSN